MQQVCSVSNLWWRAKLRVVESQSRLAHTLPVSGWLSKRAGRQTEIPESIPQNPPVRKGTFYGTKQQHAA